MWKQLSKNLGLAWGIAFLISTHPVWAGENLSSLLRQSSQGGKYVPADQREIAQAEALFSLTLQNPGDHKLAKDWLGIGFDLLQISEPGGTFAVLREQDARREGRGFYVIRLGKSDKTLLQAPHSFKDEHTREIVLNMMLQSRISAAVWNTVPRYYEENGMKIDADMAHLNQTYFLAFSRAFGKLNKDGHIIQIHGFSQGKRKSGAGGQADMVISSGTSYPTEALLKMASCLKRKLTPNALVYPTEVRELGGTTNSIGEALQQMGHAGFMHIEMSAPIRQQALKNPDLTTRFLGCLPK